MNKYVIKRNGKKEKVNLQKVLTRITSIQKDLQLDNVDPYDLATKTCQGIYDGVTTKELDELSVELATGLVAQHPEYGKLASGIKVSSLHKETPESFSKCVDTLKSSVNFDKEFLQTVEKNAKKLNKMIKPERDYFFNIVGLRTLLKSYLLKVDGIVTETPQYLYMRVAVALHGDNLIMVKETYEALSLHKYTHATPTLFNAGLDQGQLASCFLIATKEDSIKGIYDTLTETALISKNAGGIGVHVSNVRSKNSPIKGTNGISNGLTPMLKVFNETARYVDQGGGKRKGSFAIYLEPWHPDILEFLELRKNHGKEELRARDLFTALWMPDLFMEAVKNNHDWHLFDPSTYPGLQNVWGEDFKKLYLEYAEQAENNGYKCAKKIKAREIWKEIITSQIETGTPYIVYKDRCNELSNQNNLGTIKSSNLCTEIIQYSSPEETAVCNLASISLPAFLKENGEFDFYDFQKTVSLMVVNLNIVIDKTAYPVDAAKNSNLKHRPIGIGVQGLANIFCKLKLPFTSKGAQQLHEEIFFRMYRAAISQSMKLAKTDGTYSSFEGSEISKGNFPYDLYGKSNFRIHETLAEEIKTTGTRNSLLIAPMPTASTSRILGNNECFEPFTANVQTIRLLSGEFVSWNEELVKDLEKLGLWYESTRQNIIKNGGSVQYIKELPENLKEVYKTAWEIDHFELINMAVARQAYIDQSQSFNWHLDPSKHPNLAGHMTKLHFYGWENGLKTGMYYSRSKAATQAQQVTINQEEDSVDACNILDPDCESCSG